jgi:hypothetical protein
MAPLKNVNSTIRRTPRSKHCATPSDVDIVAAAYYYFMD